MAPNARALLQRARGSLIAWIAPEGVARDAGLRILGAHTDSPNLRIKPSPDRQRVGIDQLGVEVYGGVLLNSWLDRDLGFLAGSGWKPRAAPKPVSSMWIGPCCACRSWPSTFTGSSTPMD